MKTLKAGKMIDAPWTITAWDREQARGTIASRTGDVLEFDASVAFVDDFVIGEGVHIELVRTGDSFRVSRIWPDDPRFVPPQTYVPVPALDPAVEDHVAQVLMQMPMFCDYCVQTVSDDTLVIAADDANF